MDSTIYELVVNVFQILIGPAALFWLGWCYFKIQSDPELKMPSKMSAEVLESKAVPNDWSDLTDKNNFQDEEESEDEQDENKEKEQGENECCDSPDCKNNKPKKSYGDDENSETMKIGVGPVGVRGRPNKGQPDPKTMQLLLLETIRKKIEDLTDDYNEKIIKISKQEFEAKIKNLKMQEANAMKMETNQKVLAEQNMKRNLTGAREHAKKQLIGIENARKGIFQARAENRVPDHVFETETARMKKAEEHFKKMVSCSDKELMEIITMMNKQMAEIQRMKQMKEAQQKAAQERQARDEALAEASKPKEMHIM